MMITDFYFCHLWLDRYETHTIHVKSNLEHISFMTFIAQSCGLVRKYYLTPPFKCKVFYLIIKIENKLVCLYN